MSLLIHHYQLCHSPFTIRTPPTMPSSLPQITALLLLAGAACTTPEANEPGPPNIVLIFADDLGYGDLSSYGHPTIHTPRLDRMAQEGIKLTAFYVAAAACTPSRAALLTGRYPIRSGMVHVLGPDAEHGLPASEVTLAEALKAQGYQTTAIGKWHLGAQDGFFPTENDFDTYYGILYSNDMMPPWVQTQRPLELWRDTEPIEHPVDQTTLTKRYTEEAVQFIRAAKDAPFFLYLAHSMPHVPLFRSDDFVGHSKGGLYGDVIEEIDWSAGRILDVLEEQGLTDNTLVIFTSDNGPWSEMPDRMFQEDKVKPWDAGTTGPLRGTKHTTYEGGHRVPGIAYWPGRIPPGQVSNELATTMDLYTTLLKLAGADVPQDRVVDGKDIMALLEGKAASPHDHFFYFRNERLHAVRDAVWKLRIRQTDPAQPATPELYNLSIDPYERFNVAEGHPDVVERLQAQMTAFAEETGAVVDF